MLKLSSEQIEAIQNACLSDSTKIISYFSEEFEKQEKDIKIDRCLSIIAIIVSVISFLFQIFD